MDEQREEDVEYFSPFDTNREEDAPQEIALETECEEEEKEEEVPNAPVLDTISTVAQSVKPTELGPSYFVLTRLFALPDLALGGAAFYAWFRPSAFDPTWLKWLYMFVLVEALMLVTQIVLSMIAFTTLRLSIRVSAWFLVAAIFFAMAIGVSVDLQTWWPMYIFVLLAAKHVGQFMAARDELGEDLAVAECVLATLLYFSCWIITMFASIPEFGMSLEWSLKVGLSGNNAWAVDPHRGIAMAALYFTALGLAYMFLLPLRLTRTHMFKPDPESVL